MVGVAGIEPATFCSRNRRATTALHPEEIPSLPIDGGVKTVIELNRRYPKTNLGSTECLFRRNDPEVPFILIENSQEVEVPFLISFHYDAIDFSTSFH